MYIYTYTCICICDVFSFVVSPMGSRSSNKRSSSPSAGIRSLVSKRHSCITYPGFSTPLWSAEARASFTFTYGCMDGKLTTNKNVTNQWC